MFGGEILGGGVACFGVGCPVRWGYVSDFLSHFLCTTRKCVEAQFVMAVLRGSRSSKEEYCDEIFTSQHRGVGNAVLDVEPDMLHLIALALKRHRRAGEPGAS